MIALRVRAHSGTSAGDRSGRFRIGAAFSAAAFGLLAFAVSVWHADRPSFWFDELATVSAIDRSPGELWRMLGHVDAVHGLYYYVVRVWAGWFGLGEPSLRTFSSVGVGVAVALTYLLARRLGGTGLAVPAALVATMLPRVTWAGVEARSYAWVIAATTGMLLAARCVAERPSRRRWVGYGLAVLLAVALFLYTALVAVAVLVTLAWDPPRSGEPGVVSPRRWAGVRPALVATVVPLVVLSPLIGFAGSERGQVDWLQWPGWMLVPNVVVDQWFDHSWAFAVAAWTLVVAAAVLLWRGQWQRWAPVLRWSLPTAVLPVLLIVGVSTVSPMYVGRYLVCTVPGVVLVLAVSVLVVSDGIARLAPRVPVRVLTASVLLTLAVCAVPGWLWQRSPLSKPGGSDFSYAARYIRDHARPGDCVLFEVQPSWSTTSLRVAYEGLPGDFVGLRDIGDDGNRRTEGLLWDQAKGVNQWASWAADHCTSAWVLADADRAEDSWHRENGNLWWTFRAFQFMGSDMQLSLDDGGLAVVHREQFHILQVVHLEQPPPAVGPDPQALPHTRHTYWP